MDGAIHRAAGPELLAACRPLGGCETGKAKITPGFRLPAKYVIHTPGPIWRDGNHGEPELLASSYASCMELAAQYGCETVAFPSISTGVYRFPLDKAAPIALKTASDCLDRYPAIRAITFVCFDPRTRAAYDNALAELIQ